VGHSRGDKVFVPAATRLGGLVDRETHLALDDDPPLRAVAVLRDRRILSGLEQGRGTGSPLEQPQRYAVQRRLGLRQLSDEVRESRHGWGNGLGGLKVAITPPANSRGSPSDGLLDVVAASYFHHAIAEQTPLATAVELGGDDSRPRDREAEVSRVAEIQFHRRDCH